MSKPLGSIFISYETETGLRLALEAKRVITEAGYLAWMWGLDRTPGAYPAEEITKNIELCDIFLYLCTAEGETQKWNGQPYERNLAWQLNKPFRVLTFDSSFVPRMLKAYTYVNVTTERFSTQCREVIEQLTALPKVEKPVATVRDEQIAAIRQRTDRLDQDRLRECYAEIQRAYDAESIIDQLAQVKEEHDRTPSDFRVLGNSEARHLWQFNDASYHWDNYCKQLARSIAHGEKRYIFEELQQVPLSRRPIVSGSPGFDGIICATRELIEEGYNPDVLCAPISLFVPFRQDLPSEVDWSRSPKELLKVQGGPSLKVYWSSTLTPLDRLVVFDSSKTLWKVKLDPMTAHRLTVLIGEPDSPPEAVMFLAETVCKFEILDPAAIHSIAIEGQVEARD